MVAACRAPSVRGDCDACSRKGAFTSRNLHAPGYKVNDRTYSMGCTWSVSTSVQSSPNNKTSVKMGVRTLHRPCGQAPETGPVQCAVVFEMYLNVYLIYTR